TPCSRRAPCGSCYREAWVAGVVTCGTNSLQRTGDVVSGGTLRENGPLVHPGTFDRCSRLRCNRLVSDFSCFPWMLLARIARLVSSSPIQRPPSDNQFCCRPRCRRNSHKLRSAIQAIINLPFHSQGSAACRRRVF